MAYPKYNSQTTIYHGDCREVMADLPKVDAIVTDPPYGLEFMGKDWDRLDSWRDGGGFSNPGVGQRSTPWTSFGGETANPSCRICGGRSRGIRKCSCQEPSWHVNGKDFDPNSRRIERALGIQHWHHQWAVTALDVLKPGGHLLAFGGTRTHHRLMAAIEDAGFEIRDCLMWVYGTGFPKSLDVSKAIDKLAGAEREVVGTAQGMGKQNPEWNGMAQGRKENYFKPKYSITAPATDAAKQWEGYGTALKPAWEPIVLARKPLQGTVAKNVLEHGVGALSIDACRVQGRFPANLLHDGSDEVTTLFPSNTNRGHIPKSRGAGGVSTSGHKGQDGLSESHFEPGSTSRFFYCAKASKSERGQDNNHPTVKPLALVRYLVKLICPAGSLVLDPFMGSGTTLIAAYLEGVRAIGIESDESYCDIAVSRLSLHGLPGLINPADTIYERQQKQMRELD